MTRTHARAAVALAAVCIVSVAACGRTATKSKPSPSGTSSVIGGLVTTTPPGTKSASSVVWAVYRNVASLDPIMAFDYPENTSVSLMCESLLRQAPDGALQPGLASVSTPNPTSLVFTLKPNVKFWDGTPVTAADVVYSLNRAADAKLGGFYSAVFTRVQSINASGANQVTISLKQPDFWLQGELASMPGTIVEKAYAEKQGKNFGTPSGGTMCTGAYRLKSWTSGATVDAIPNTNYWDPSVKPLTQLIRIKGVADASALTSGLLTGAIQGSYPVALPILDRLRQSNAVTVYQGAGWLTDAFIVSNFHGPLGDVRVRQALSTALDRQGLIDSVYKGAGLIPRWLSNPGTFGYGKGTFEKAYAAAPEMKQNLDQAKKLAQEAGVAGKSITIGMTSELANVAATAGAYRTAGQAIGLKVTLKSVPAQSYINFFTDAKARQGIDGFTTVNYGDYADPAAFVATVALPEGSQNYTGFNDPKLTSLLEQARSTADPDARAALVAKAETLTAQDLPWIPNVQPNSVLVMSKKLTGAVPTFSYMFAPWANQLGGTG